MKNFFPFLWLALFSGMVTGQQALVDFINRSLAETMLPADTGDRSLRSNITVNVKVYLEGAYSSVAGRMTTALNPALIPLNQPYNRSPWNYAGPEQLPVVPAVMTDWVLVELRTQTAGSSMVARSACLLTREGTVTGLNGIDLPLFEGVTAGDYYVVIRHRNHLAVMTASAIPLSESSSLYDFTMAPDRAYGANPMVSLGNGSFGMFSGDANGNGSINNIDLVQWRTNFSRIDYNDADLFADGVVNSLDYIKWRRYNAKRTAVPN